MRPPVFVQLPQRVWQNPLTQRVLRNTSYLFGANAVSAGLSMVQSVLAARLLGVAGFGLLGAITQFVTVANRLTSFRMSELVVNYVGEFHSQGDDRSAAATFKAAGLTEMASSLLAFGVVAALAPLASRVLLKDPLAADVILVYAVVLLANLMAESANGLLSAFNRFRWIALVNVGQSIATLCLIGAAFVARGSLFSVVAAYMIGKSLSAVTLTGMALWLARAEWGAGWWHTPLTTLAGRRSEMMRFGVSTNINGTVNLVTRDSEILWLSAFSSPLQVGYYKLALAILGFLLIPVDPLINTTYREVAREVAGRQWANVRYLLRSGTLLAAGFTLPAILLLVIFGQPLMSALWGAEFLPTAYDALLILLAGGLAANLLYWSRKTLLSLGLPGYPTLVSLVAAAVKVVGIILLVPTWGAVGMAVLLAGFFIATSTIQAGRAIVELKHVARSEPTPVGG